MKNDESLLLRLPSELKDAINAQAATMDRSASWLIRNLMVVYLEGLKNVDTPQ